MGTISGLTYEGINQIANDLKSKANDMNTTLNEIKGQMNKIGQDSVWSGTAASKDKEEFDKLSKKFPEFYDAVKNCSDYLLKIVERYQAVDKAIMNGSKK